MLIKDEKKICGFFFFLVNCVPKSSNKNTHHEKTFHIWKSLVQRIKLMLDSLITSKTRIKLLMKFFINSDTTAYLRNLASEFGESTNGIRQELNHLEEARLLESETVQNRKVYHANINHPFFGDIHHLLLKYVGVDQVVDELIKHIGHLEKAFITNDFAQGKPGNIIDLVLVGHHFDDVYLNQLVKKTEANVSFKIQYITVEPNELPQYIQDKTKSLLVWSAV